MSWHPPSGSSSNSNPNKPKRVVGGGAPAAPVARDSSSGHNAAVQAAAAAVFRRQRVLSEEEGEIGEEGEIRSPGSGGVQALQGALPQPQQQHQKHPQQPLIRDHRKEAAPRRGSWSQPSSSGTPATGPGSTIVGRGAFDRRQRSSSATSSTSANANVGANAVGPVASPASLPASAFHARDRDHNDNQQQRSRIDVSAAGGGGGFATPASAGPAATSRPTDPRFRAAAAAPSPPSAAAGTMSSTTSSATEVDNPGPSLSPMPPSRTSNALVTGHLYHGNKERLPLPTPPFRQSPRIVPERRRSAQNGNPDAKQSPPEANKLAPPAIPQLPIPTHAPKRLGSYSSLADNSGESAANALPNNAASDGPAVADHPRVFSRDHHPRERDAPTIFRGTECSNNKEHFGAPPLEQQPPPRVARATSAELRHYGSAHHHNLPPPPRSPMQQPRGQRSLAFSSPHRTAGSPGAAVAGSPMGTVGPLALAASPVPPFPSPAVPPTTSPVTSKPDITMSQSQQLQPPQRPSFHRNDPRFAKQQQQLQQQQQQHLQLQRQPSMENRGPIGSAEMPLRRSSSSDIGGPRTIHNKTPPAFSGDMMVRRSSSSDIPEHADWPKDRPTNHARSWSATASPSGTASSSNHPDPSSARPKIKYTHHESATTTAFGEQQRRRISYPASPGDGRPVVRDLSKDAVTDSFGRSREWLQEPPSQSSPRSRRSMPPLSSPHGSGPSTMPGPPNRGSDELPGFPAPTTRRPAQTQDAERKSMTSFGPHQRAGFSHCHNSHAAESGFASSAAPEIGASPMPHVKTRPLPEADKKLASPLLASSLGDSTVVARAEAAVVDLSSLLSNPQLLPSEGKQSSLPSKHLIMKAVAILTSKIKQAETEASKAEDEFRTAKQQESEERDRKRQKLAEEEAGMVKEQEQEWEERKRQQKEAHALKLKDIVAKRRAALDEEQRQSDEALAKKIQQAQEAKRTVLEGEIKDHLRTAAQSLDSDIAKVRQEYDRVYQAAEISETKAVAMDAEYRQVQAAYKTMKRDSAAGEKSQEDPSDIVASILAENQRKALEGHSMCLSLAREGHFLDKEELAHEVDPKFHRTHAEWNALANAVTGPADALYSEPCEAPYFEENEKTHRRIVSTLKEYVRRNKRKLDGYLTELAEEYDYRKRKYAKQMLRRGHPSKHSGRASLSVARQSILGGKTSSNNSTDILGASGRASNNPYRRARRGNEVRSEYEQEQIIAELAAKEAMEKRIAFGGCELPRQRCKIDEAFTPKYVNTLKAQKVDPMALEEESSITNTWSDMEKCIFLDRFLQHPKDFRKIASFLRNKTTKDCVSFYYDSKQTVPYKAALKEHMMRRKRRGDYPIWDATIQAAISTGAVVTAGPNEQKPLVFTLPPSDGTYFTRDLHPLKREVFDKMPVGGRKVKAKMPVKTGKYAHRRREPFFLLNAEQKKYLTASSKDCLISSATPLVPKKKVKATIVADDDLSEPIVPEKLTSDAVDPGRSTPTRRAPQKWTAAEKKTFLETLDKHGRNWERLSAAVGTKTISQIKNYYYDYKKQVGKFRLEKKSKGGDAKLKKAKGDEVSIEHSETKERVSRDTVSPPQGAADYECQLQLDPEGDDESQDFGSKREIEDPESTSTAGSLEAEARQRDHNMQLLQEQHRLQQEQQQRQMEREILHRQEQQRQQQQQMEQQQALQQQHALQQSLFQQQWQQQQIQRQQQQAHLQQQSHQQRQHHQQLAHSQQQLHQLHLQNRQQQQQQPNRVESGDIPTNNAESLAAELWSQAQQQAVLNQHRAGHLTVEEARRLLQHHSQSHHQQVLSSLLPWVSATQMAQAAQAASVQQEGGAQNSMQDWSDATAHLQNLMALRHQQPGGGHGLLALAGLSNRNPGTLRDNPGTNAGTGPINPAASQQSEDNEQLALAQRLLAFSGGQAESRPDVSSLEALGLLAMATPRADAGSNPNNFLDQARDHTGQQDGQPDRY